jgi:hypothetical protein
MVFVEWQDKLLNDFAQRGLGDGSVPIFVEAQQYSVGGWGVGVTRISLPPPSGAMFVISQMHSSVP